MEIQFVILFSILAAFCGMLVVTFWLDKFNAYYPDKLYLIIPLVIFIISFLFLMFAPEELYIIAGIAGTGITFFTLIVFLIFGR
jgi:hypothetical protein